ncbi:vacuolar protein sorting-associated protein 18 homolog isoform X1 [Haliotis rufescens]|uniref:vacuolar protein sorting-associated protein 18 homolog isoform X1 n=1 Tax=Haliotis rufescens TaxID=6454 RepID=UPI001EB09EC9|nr:vacuolar protein sorting-associated protein 18 homolog isoform X1 [Haliotis rufescens]
MASILDQYEEESARQASGIRQSPAQSLQEPIGVGFIDARLETESPIFNKKKVNFKPPDIITHLDVCNNFLVMVMSSNIMLRLDLEHPDNPDEVEIPRAVDDKVHKIFLDPTGKHLIISMKCGDNYYLSRNSKKPKPIAKLKGHLIDSVGWNWQNANEATTSAILLGTSKGIIFETELTANEDSRFFQGSLDQYLRQLKLATKPHEMFNLGREKAQSVTSLQFDRLPSTTMTEYRYYILATTPGRLYQFIGTVSTSAEPPMFMSLFQQYETGVETVQFLELPGDFGYSELHLFFPKFRQAATKFAWMTGPGIYYGDIDVTGAAGPNSVLSNAKLMPYPKEVDEKPAPPISMLLTEFHVLILYPDRLKAVCVLNEQLIYDDVYVERFGRLLGCCKDPIRGQVWTYTTTSVFKYKIVKEARDVWQMYLDKGQFELAREYCKDNPSQLDKVLTKQAEYLFENRKYEASAAMYAETQNSFEEIALKFIRLPQKEALKTFVQKKLSALRPSDKTQMTMLVTWLIELYLNQLGELKEQGMDDSEDYMRIQEQFRKFLGQTRVKETASNNRGVVYDLIASHGDVEDMVFFAVLMKDYERVISHHIQHENYKGALDVLKKQSEVELYYKFSPLLMQYTPKETVDAWMTQHKYLDPKQLIPALVQYDHHKYREQGNEAIRYLEFCVHKLGNKDSPIHNYLLSLYAKLQSDQLMTYLNLQGEDVDDVSYDLKYALRLCSEYGHKRACVHVYSLMGLYEEAVDMALSVDVELAKTQADKPDEDDIELRKKLWLRIARHVVEEEKDIKRAMDFLHECDLLKIEDILPFFPDFVTIDHFKDAIITSLHEYNDHIKSLKDEMEEATQSAEEIRKEIQSFRNKYAFVKAEDKCSSCSYPLMVRAFYLFPCQHKFHMDCLIADVLPSLSGSKKSKVDQLQRKLAERDEAVPYRKSTSAAQIGVNRDAEVKAELDDLVASECIYCGDFMIRCIDKPFIEDDEWKSAEVEWE